MNKNIKYIIFILYVYLFQSINASNCIGQFIDCKIVSNYKSPYIKIIYMYNISYCDTIDCTIKYKNTIQNITKIKTKSINYQELDHICNNINNFNFTYKQQDNINLLEEFFIAIYIILFIILILYLI